MPGQRHRHKSRARRRGNGGCWVIPIIIISAIGSYVGNTFKSIEDPEPNDDSNSTSSIPPRQQEVPAEKLMKIMKEERLLNEEVEGNSLWAFFMALFSVLLAIFTCFTYLEHETQIQEMDNKLDLETLRKIKAEAFDEAKTLIYKKIQEDEERRKKEETSENSESDEKTVQSESSEIEELVDGRDDKETNVKRKEDQNVVYLDKDYLKDNQQFINIENSVVYIEKSSRSPSPTED